MPGFWAAVEDLAVDKGKRRRAAATRTGGRRVRVRDDPALYEGVKASYETSHLTVAAIGDQFGVSANWVGYRARRDGWLRHRGSKLAAERRRRLKQLGDALDIQLEVATSRITSADEQTPERARAARTVGDISRTLERMNKMIETYKKEAEHSAATERDAFFDGRSVEDIRLEIKRRLDRIIAESDTEPVAGQSEPNRASDS